MEPTSKSQKISTSRALIIEEKDLVLFLDWLKIQYLRIELEAVCNGNISITNLDAGRLLEQLTVGHHRLLTLNVTAFAESIHPEPYRRFGSLRLRIGTRWDGTVVADLSGTDDRFYRVRDRIQQFLDSCTAWYHPIYSCRLHAYPL